MSFVLTAALLSPASPRPTPWPTSIGLKGGIAYTDTGGTGTLVLCVPGLGEVRQPGGT